MCRWVSFSTLQLSCLLYIFKNQNTKVWIDFSHCWKNRVFTRLSCMLDKRAFRTHMDTHFFQRTSWSCVTGDVSTQTQLCSLCWGWCPSLQDGEMECCWRWNAACLDMPPKQRTLMVLPGQHPFRKWQKYCKYKNMLVSTACFSWHKKHAARKGSDPALTPCFFYGPI